MKKAELWLSRNDVERMLEVLNQHPDFDRNFKLIYNSGSIGYCIDMELAYKNVFEQVNIVNQDSW
jgi:hypothetical protein